MAYNNIIEFIGLEYHNELASVANLKEEFLFLKELDEIYQEIQHAFMATPNNQIITIMFLQAHTEFYVGMSQFLRCHLSKAFLSLRIAIDASFNAYYLTKHSEHTKDFIDDKGPLQKKVFWRIKDYISKKPQVFPLAHKLIKIHEVASNFAAHSSMQSIAYKYESENKEMLLCYFDKLQINEFMWHYFVLLIGYFKIWQLFYNCFFINELKIVCPERDRRVAAFEKNLILKSKQYRPGGASHT